MAKGRFPKFKESICNIPIDVANIAIILPRSADSNGLNTVQLKRKLIYYAHVYFETVRSASHFIKH